ncbi:1-acylglycerol-3-phosphate O-acyltransferase [Marinomonas epiphytica]
MLLLFRGLALSVLILFVTLFGILFCLAILTSKDRVFYIAKVFSSVSRLFGLSVETRTDPESVKVQQAVYLANHQNNFDMFTLSAAVPRGVVTVGKSTLKWLPFFGQLYWVSGNVLINRNNNEKAIATIDQVVASMRATGLSILMFPEGTRSRGRGWLPFKRGAFFAAVQAGVPIVPMVCSDTHKQVKWNRRDNGKVIVQTLAPIYTDGLSEEDVPALLEDCRHKMQEAKRLLDQELAS